MRSIFISAKTSKVKHDLGISGLLHCGLLGDVEAVKELPDILVLHGGRLLDEGGRLGHALDGVALDNQLILLILAVLNCDTRVHPHLPDELLSKEVTDLNKSASLGDGAVDWEMRIHPC